jgi:hypothetical protein
MNRLKFFLNKLSANKLRANKLKIFPNQKEFFNFFGKQKNVLEVGVDEGHNVRHNLIPILQPKNLFLIDIWEKIRPSKRNLIINKCKSVSELEKIKLNKKNELVDYVNNLKKYTGNVFFITADSHEAALYFPNNYFDFIYIDGCHEKKHVKKDLELYFSKVKKGGVLAGDDYADLDDTILGCKEAIQEFLEENNLKLIAISKSRSVDWATIK